jgi:glutamate carboxypeptidase
MRHLLSFAEAQRPWLLDALEALVRAESPSTSKEAVDRCGAILASQLQAIGAEVERLPQQHAGDHLLARFGSGVERPVLMLGHFDTVWEVGQIEKMPFRTEDGRLHGPGILDMKGGIAVAMQALRCLQATLPEPPPVVMLWTTDEEIGSRTSRQIIEEQARQCRAVLVLEPSLPGGAVKTWRKGCGDFELTIHGAAAHAGIEPGKGANALHELAHQTLAIAALQDVSRGISVNVTVAGGGARTNVIPDRAHARIDARAPTMDDARRIESALAALTSSVPGTRLEIAGGFGRPPMERTPAGAALYEVARQVAAELGRSLGEGGTGGGSDGNFTAAIGVPTIDGLGPQGDGPHALHEHVLIDDLAWRPAFLTGLLTRLSGTKEVK